MKIAEPRYDPVKEMERLMVGPLSKVVPRRDVEALAHALAVRVSLGLDLSEQFEVTCLGEGFGAPDVVTVHGSVQSAEKAATAGGGGNIRSRWVGRWRNLQVWYAQGD
jgi:hypothetical protein